MPFFLFFVKVETEYAGADGKTEISEYPYAKYPYNIQKQQDTINACKKFCKKAALDPSIESICCTVSICLRSQPNEEIQRILKARNIGDIFTAKWIKSHEFKQLEIATEGFRRGENFIEWFSTFTEWDY